MSLLNNFRNYTQNRLSKSDYIQKQYDDIHSIVFEYSKYLRNTDIKEIRINDQNVSFVTRSHGLEFICPEGDLRSSPIETINFKDYEINDSKMIKSIISPGDTCNISLYIVYGAGV